MGNKRNRRSRRVESRKRFRNRDENASGTSFTQGSELTKPSQNSNEIESITQRLSEQNISKMRQIEQQLNSEFEEILIEIKTNRESSLVNDEEGPENNRPSTSNSEKKLVRRKHASNNEIDKDKNQDNRFHSYEMYELRQPSTPFGVANETLDDTIIINQIRQEADYHMVTGPSKNILRQSSNSSNTTNTVGPNAEHLFLEHSAPSHPLSQIAQANEKLAR